jgi:hypothetical protein
VRKTWKTLCSDDVRKGHPRSPFEKSLCHNDLVQRLSPIDALRSAIERAQRKGAALRRLILERAFRGELVPQDPSDEPAETLLDRIRVGRAVFGSDGPQLATNRKSSYGTLSINHRLMI